MGRTIQKNPHIGTVAVLQSKPGKENALRMLKEIAYNVSFLMKEERFKVKQLVEFYPRDRTLLGMNVNRGMKIMLRLRDPLDEFQFLSMECIMGTMLHELTHNIHGAHDRKFYEKLDQLSGRQWTIEQLGLFDNFIGAGTKLGIKPKGTFPLTKRGERRLGSSSSKKNVRGVARSPREMAAIAAKKRYEDSKSCGNPVTMASLVPASNELEVVVIDDIEHDDIEDGDIANHDCSETKIIYSENGTENSSSDKRRINSEHARDHVDSLKKGNKREHLPTFKFNDDIEIIDLT